jgi:hypothetical protein
MPYGIQQQQQEPKETGSIIIDLFAADSKYMACICIIIL